MKAVLSLSAMLWLCACQNNNSAELNQCAQQNYQCEASCAQSNTPETMSHRICDNECIERFNQCKVQAEQLTKSKNTLIQ